MSDTSASSLSQDTQASEQASKQAKACLYPELGPVWAVCVTYNTGEEARETLSAAARQVDKLVVVDNASDAETMALLEALSEEFSLEIIANADNQGLATAQNQGICAALDAGASWILLLDDDSTCAEGMVAAYAAAERAHPGIYHLMAPRLNYSGLNRIPQCMVDTGGRLLTRAMMPVTGILEGPAFVIASGSLIRADVFQSVGLMREDFFIDYLDVDFCLRLIEAGRRIAVVGDAVLEHHLGAMSEHRLWNTKIWTTNHSASRCFTMARNRSRLWREKGRQFPSWLLYDIMATGFQIFRITLFEDQKSEKIGKIVRGLALGLFKWCPQSSAVFKYHPK